MGVYYEDLKKKWLHDKGTALYSETGLYHT